MVCMWDNPHCITSYAHACLRDKYVDYNYTFSGAHEMHVVINTIYTIQIQPFLPKCGKGFCSRECLNLREYSN